jgi:hypothetical protein
MTRSPCLNCPNRHLDKNLCLESCDLLNRLQTFEALHRERASCSAVDAADEGRYRITTAFDLRRSSVSTLPF